MGWTFRIGEIPFVLISTYIFLRTAEVSNTEIKNDDCHDKDFNEQVASKIKVSKTEITVKMETKSVDNIVKGKTKR